MWMSGAHMRHDTVPVYSSVGDRPMNTRFVSDTVEVNNASAGSSSQELQICIHSGAGCVMPEMSKLPEYTSFAGITSIINLYEAPVASLQEKLGLKRVPATAVIHVIGLAAALCIQAIVSQWMDVVSIYICPLGALLAAVMFFWIGGKKLVLESVNLGARKPIGGWYYPAGKYVYCVSVLVALIAGALLGGIG
mgnify:CR=1 FL=1